MKKILLSLVIGILALLPQYLSAQDEGPKGTPLARIFANYSQQLNGDESFRGFSVKRAYIGYKYYYDSRISAQIVLDIGKPLSGDDITLKRYAFVKNALIQYKVNDDLTISGGITEVKGSSLPNSYWGRKYVRYPFLLEYKLMNSADLGLLADYKISDMVSIDFGIFNGEGYTKIQSDNILQYTAGITISPADGLAFRLYGDIHKGEDASRKTISGFAAYKNKSFMIGLEYTYQTDMGMVDLHNIYGYSAIASVNLAPKLDLFGRFDKISSIIPDGETDPWNLSADGRLLVGGIQYTYAKYIKFSLSYQGWTPDDNNESRLDYIQLSALFRF